MKNSGAITMSLSLKTYSTLIIPDQIAGDQRYLLTVTQEDASKTCKFRATQENPPFEFNLQLDPSEDPVQQTTNIWGTYDLQYPADKIYHSGKILAVIKGEFLELYPEDYHKPPGWRLARCKG